VSTATSAHYVTAFDFSFYSYVVERGDLTTNVVAARNLVLVRSVEDPTLSVARQVLAREATARDERVASAHVPA
jgi:hypothetical protein